jgi:hypothetical protein
VIQSLDWQNLVSNWLGQLDRPSVFTDHVQLCILISILVLLLTPGASPWFVLPDPPTLPSSLAKVTLILYFILILLDCICHWSQHILFVNVNCVCLVAVILFVSSRACVATSAPFQMVAQSAKSCVEERSDLTWTGDCRNQNEAAFPILGGSQKCEPGRYFLRQSCWWHLCQCVEPWIFRLSA